MPEIYRLAEDVVFREVDGGGVLLSKRSGAYRQVNVTGSRVLRLVSDGASIPGIIEMMATAFPAVARQTLTTDVQQMLDSLVEAGVVRHD